MTKKDAIMVGGGVMGCAIAYYLLKLEPQFNVAIVETDPTYTYASTTLSEGNLRVQFNLKENIQMSQYGLEVLERFGEEMAVAGRKPDVAFRRQGNLFLVDEAGREEAEQGLALQKRLGCQVEWLTPEDVQRRYPLYNALSCAGGTFGRQDGTMDPHAVLMGYKNKAIALGAQFIQA
jgi:glycine/D-amino acid oxidase-like deaminating enzyme